MPYRPVPLAALCGAALLLPAAAGAAAETDDPAPAPAAVAASAPVPTRAMTVKVLAPWQGKGEVYQIGPETLLFLGPYEGIMYIETGAETLDAAIFTCPSTTEIRQFEDRFDARGHCAITSSRGDLAFAEFSCSGGQDACRGEFVVTGGTGRLTGISGRGEVIVRTALSGMVEDAETGALISSVEGLAVWPALELHVPLAAIDEGAD
jgi:hypothetical protein